MKRCYHCKKVIFKDELVMVLNCFPFHKECLEKSSEKIPAPEYWTLPDGSVISINKKGGE